MTIIVNKAPPPPPPSPVADRPWLERADRSIRAIRVLVLIIAGLAIAAGIVAVKPSNGGSLLLIPGAIAWALTGEVVFIIARACIATAWAARKPDGQP